MISKCVVCEKEFDRRGRAKCCSPKCSLSYREETTRQRSRKWYSKNKQRCLANAKKWAGNNKQRRKEIYTAYRRKQGITPMHIKIICEGCKKEVIRTAIGQKYCAVCSRKASARRVKAWIKNNIQIANENIRKYRFSEKGKLTSRLNVQRRLARKKGVIHNFTKEEWKNKLAKTNGFCSVCNKLVGTDKLSMDHIYPLSEAHKYYLATGEKLIYQIGDVDPICRKCNSKKSNKIDISSSTSAVVMMLRNKLKGKRIKVKLNS